MPQLRGVHLNEPWNLYSHHGNIAALRFLRTSSSRLVEHQGGKTFTKFYSYLELCIASISFSTVFLRTGIYEETVSMVFSPYNFTFTVLSCNSTSPLRRIREHGEKLILPSFADFCLSDSLTHAHYAVWHLGRLCLSENIGI